MRWVHVTTLDGMEKGWIRVDASDYPCVIDVNGVWTDANEVFGNLLYAD